MGPLSGVLGCPKWVRPRSSGGIVADRHIEAELWGVHGDVLLTPGLEIRKAAGAYGTLYEVECGSLWKFWRLSAYLAELLPAGARYNLLDGDTEEHPDGPVLTLHFWEDAPHSIRTGGSAATQVRKPT